MASESNLQRAAETTDDLPSPNDVLDGREEIPLEELFSESFLTENTEFDTFDEMVEASPSPVSSADELSHVAQDEWSDFVAETTSFEDERELLFAARDHWVATRLGL